MMYVSYWPCDYLTLAGDVDTCPLGSPIYHKVYYFLDLDC